MTWVSAAIVPLAREVSGSGPGLLLVHGITEDRSFFAPVVPLLAGFGTVVAVDLPGHGRSARAASYALRDLAADLHRAYRASGVPGDPVLVGHSLGGLLAVVYAGSFPTRGVVVVDQPLDLAPMQAQLLEAEPVLRGEGFEPFMAGLFEAMRGGLDEQTHAALAARRRPVREVVTAIWAPLLDDTPGELDGMVEDLVAAVHVPLLSLHGLDPGPEYEEWLTARIPTARVEVWTDEAGRPLGHHPHLVQPERFAARIQEFATML